MVASERPTLFLLDGYALIYRAFFAMIARPLKTSRGENTSAEWGVANFLLRLTERYHPQYVAWVQDAGTSFRHEVFPEYKATREKLEPALQQDFDRSVERIAQLLRGFHIPLVVQQGYEADDVIGTLATRAAAADLQVVIVSGDKDFYQLIGPHVALLNPGRGGPAAVNEQWVDLSNANERLGVPPARVVDYLALVGDSSDNVPGVRGIGDKTARQLVATYGDLDAILAHAEDIPTKRAREALLGNRANALLSRDLVTIRRDVPMALDLEALKAQPADREELARQFADLEFHSLLPKLEGAPPPPTETFTLLNDASALSDVVAQIRRASQLALRTFTTDEDPLRGTLVGFALGVGEGRGWYFPLAHRAPAELGAEAPVNLPALDDPAMRPLAQLLSDDTVPKTGHDLKRDWLALRRAGVELGGVVLDVMVASFLLEPGRRSHALDVLCFDHLGTRLPPRKDLVGHGRRQRSIAEVPPADVCVFAGASSDAVLRLRAAFAPDLDGQGVRRLLEEIEIPLIGVLVNMEWRGIRVDETCLTGLSREFGAALAELEQRIYQEAGTDFNINSTPQLRHILFEKLQLPVIKKTKTGPSTDADVLGQLAEMGFAVPTLLLEYRELTKLRSTYVDALPRRINPETGRIHTTFNQTGAATGRLSSSDPNLQNIPVRTARGERIRACFVPAQGCRLIVADYSQVELRILAHLSGDEAFIAAFLRGGDIHRETAAIIFGVPVEAVTGEMRARAKTINFATIYGQGPFALSRQLGIAQDEARRFIDTYFERFAGVRAFLDATIEKARDQGYVETIFGRRRYIPELRDKSHNVRAFGERTAMNSPMQGSAADLIKIAMVRLDRVLSGEGLRTGMLLQVHDELVLEAPQSEVDRGVAMVRGEMEGAATLRVPLIVDVGVGDNWLDAKR